MGIISNWKKEREINKKVKEVESRQAVDNKVRDIKKKYGKDLTDEEVKFKAKKEVNKEKKEVARQKRIETSKKREKTLRNVAGALGGLANDMDVSKSPRRNGRGTKQRSGSRGGQGSHGIDDGMLYNGMDVAYLPKKRKGASRNDNDTPYMPSRIEDLF